MNALQRPWAGNDSLCLLAMVALFVGGCAESAPDDATPVNIEQSAGEQSAGADNAARTSKGTVQTPTKHKPNVDPRRGNVDEGIAVDLVPKVETEPPGESTKLEPLDGELSGGKEVDLAPAVESPSRARRRMNIDQLNAALRRVSGGIGWTAGSGWQGKSAGSDNFNTLALTLGKPNYTDVTAEDLEPGALFQKFLGDAASSICMKLINRDKAEKSATKRVLMRHVKPTDTSGSNAAGVDKNLAALILRFHGRKLAPKSGQLQQWRFLFTSATKVSKSPTMGWRAVCVALIQHPRFYTY